MQGISFPQYIGQLPPEMVFRHLLADAKEARKIVSATTVRSIVERFSTPEALIARFKALPDACKLECAFVYLAGDKGVRTSPVEDFEGHKLLCSFLVCEVRDEGNGCALVGFDEFEPTLRPYLAKVVAKRTKAEPQELSASPLPWYCLNDLMVVAGLASQGHLKRTKGGTLAKTAHAQLDSLLHAAKAARQSGTDQYIPVLLEYGVRKGLLIFRDNGYCTRHRGVTEWLTQPVSALHTDFVEAALQSTSAWRKEILLEILAAPGEPWLCATQFPRELSADIIDTVRILTYVALVSVRTVGEDVFFSRAADAAPQWSLEQAHILVMPDFTAIVPQEIGPVDLYWFMRLGTLSTLDGIYHGRIDRKVINESLVQGVSGEAIIDRLRQWQAPSNVVETAREWIREFSRVSICTETFLISSDERVSAQIAGLDPLKGLVEAVPAHRVFKVRKGYENQVQTMLFEMGFDPRMPGALEPRSSEDELNGNGREPSTPHRTLITRFCKVTRESGDINPKSGKYSSELKALDANEAIHVIEYAILMGYTIRFEYEGSPGMKKGLYAAQPLSIEKGMNPVIVVQLADKPTPRRFSVKEIIKLGVDAEAENDR